MLNPRISAYAMLEGQFDFNRTPMAPPGNQILVHSKPQQRKTWAPFAMDGWYLGPAVNHYRCFTTYIPSTGGTRISDTVEFIKPTQTAPMIDKCSLLVDAESTLTAALQSTSNMFSTYKEEQLEALKSLATIFQQTIKSNHIMQHHQRVPNNNNTPQRVQPYSIRHLQPPHRAKQPVNYASTVRCPRTGSPLEFRHLLQSDMATTWKTLFANKLARLADGLPSRNINGTNTIQFIHPSSIPNTKRITYGRIVVDIKPHKSRETSHQTHGWGDLLQCNDDTFTPTADLTTIKVLLNSTVSTPNAKFITCDIQNFYLNSNLPDPEYMKIPTKYIPHEIFEHYNLTTLAKNDYIFLKITKGMYGLKQAGILAYNDLKTHLSPHGYALVRHTPGLWRHTSNSVSFTLVVDDFGIKYTHLKDAQHVLNTISSNTPLPPTGQVLSTAD